MSKKKLLLSLFIFALAFALRYHNFAYHSPFDWDQNRDYSQLLRIVSGELVVLGPVAKGVGGFYLGSLYYYLLVPAYLLLSGSLSALPLTSIFFDALTASLIYLLLSRFLSKKVAISSSIFWVFSWFLINASRVSWNVSLIPIWSLLVISISSYLNTNFSNRILYLLAFIGGLSIHIHVSLIALTPIIILLFFRDKLSLRNLLSSAVSFSLPFLPLILFDLTHNFQNTHLFLFQFKSQATAVVGVIPMLKMAIIKFGKVFGGLIIAQYRDNLILGILAILLAIRAVLSHNFTLRFAGFLTLASFIQVLLLHDYHFPEYYFAPAYLSLIIIFFTYLNNLLTLLPRFSRLSLGAVLLILVVINYQAVNNSSPGGYSLGAKEEIVLSLHDLPQPLSLSYQLNPGREGGFDYLVELNHIEIESGSNHRAVISDKLSSPIYVDGELTEEKFRYGDLKVSYDVVQ